MCVYNNYVNVGTCTYLAHASARFLTMEAFVLKRSSLVIPGEGKCHTHTHTQQTVAEHFSEAKSPEKDRERERERFFETTCPSLVITWSSDWKY